MHPAEIPSGCDSPKPPAADVPVFGCHVLLAGPDENGRFKARLSNLDGVIGTGGSERQALLSIVTAFKAVASDYLRNNEPIPWKETADQPATGETERWIPVHL